VETAAAMALAEPAPVYVVVPPRHHVEFGDRSVPRTEIMQQRVPLHGSSRPLYMQNGDVYAPNTRFSVQEWAQIPIHLFEKNKDPEYVVEIHHSGTKVRTWNAATGWKESNGFFKKKDAAGNGIGRRKFGLKDKDFSASVLVAHAFWGDPPSKTRNFVLHIVRVEERSEQSDDSVRNVRWGTDKENKEDRTADGQASNKEGLKIAVWGKPVAKDKISLDLPPGTRRDPRFKDGTYARFDSMADAERIINAHIDSYNRTAETPLTRVAASAISEALSGKRGSAGGWGWLYDSVPEPAAADLRRLDNSQRGERYGTRDGRLLYKKWTSDTTYVYVQTTQTAPPSGYLKTGLNDEAPDELGGIAPFHRIIAFLFNRAQLDAKLASTGLRMEDLEVDHDDNNPLNNAASNLVWRTHAEHAAKTNGHRIDEKTVDGTYVGTFSTIKDAAASANMNKGTFLDRLKAGGGSTTITSNGTTRYFFRAAPVEAAVKDDDESEDDSEADDEDIADDKDDVEDESDAMDES
jgi:hypothetical protein